MTIATAINLSVATKYYRIRFRSIFSFCGNWFGSLKGLLTLHPYLDKLPRYHLEVHLAWLGANERAPVRYVRVERTKRWKELCIVLGEKGVIPADPKLMYESLYAEFEKSHGLLDWDLENAVEIDESEEIVEDYSAVLEFFNGIGDDDGNGSTDESEPLRKKPKLGKSRVAGATTKRAKGKSTR
jgi:hypothetical protein